MLRYALRRPWALLGLGGAWAQPALPRDTDTVALGPGYGLQVYYTLRRGIISTVPLTRWHLAFEVAPRGAAIRTNHAANVTVYKTRRDTTSWASLGLEDTTERLYDDLCRWTQGALNRTANPNNPADFGWGLYNPSTRIVTGDSLYILQVGQTYYKVWIKELRDNAYYLRTAALDGSGELNTTVPKSLAASAKFVYYDISAGQALALEPPAAEWDLLFTQYVAFVTPPSGGPAVPYSVVGVFQNPAVRVARVRLTQQANPDTLTLTAYTLDSCLSTIGHDWKEWDGTQWRLADTLYFLVRDGAGALWRLRFIGFEGHSTGRLLMEKVRLADPTSLRTDQTLTPGHIYPQPAQTELNLHAPFPLRTVELYGLSGQLAYRWEALAGAEVRLTRPPFLPSGLYFLRLIGETQEQWAKVILE
ncbi:MAG: T9SS type A sorting domain-containing protein [Bacteroidia bacterium]|nr:T9SS type A sorting domain-containing protein [Bacteroidia bacterium]MDW8089704.1 T9SS type A sorting domain-containing protein [Bacteroidia bacterium]